MKNDGPNSTVIKIGKNQKKTILITKSGNYTVELVGEGAEAQIIGAFLGRGDEEIVIKTLQHHKAPHTKSNLLVKTVLRDRSRFSYDGLIKIDASAQQSDAYQRNENLLLSEHAHVDTKPELEILANDVRCTHGATIGYVDTAALFYLMSRGLSKSHAINLLVDGFFAGIFTKIDNTRQVDQLKSDLGMV